MDYKACKKEKDIMSIMWNVFASFGYIDAVKTETEEDHSDILRYAVDEGLVCRIVLKNCTSVKGMAEIVSVATEASLAADCAELRIGLKCPQAVGELLYLFSLDEYMDISEGQFQFTGYNGDYTIFKGFIDGNDLVCEFDMVSTARSMNNAHITADVPETIIFSEVDGEGIAYEISYTMRLSGCLVTNYLGEGDINDCEAYAEKNGIESIIRVFPDGKIQIKDASVPGGVTETDYQTFVGYYDEALDEECEDEHEHEHHAHGCDCGHCC